MAKTGEAQKWELNCIHPDNLDNKTAVRWGTVINQMGLAQVGSPLRDVMQKAFEDGLAVVPDWSTGPTDGDSAFETEMREVEWTARVSRTRLGAFLVMWLLVAGIALQALPGGADAGGGANSAGRSSGVDGPPIGATETATVWQGDLRGVMKVGIGNTYVTEYKGIPYALPPLGEGRFAPPRYPVSWDGELNATEFKHSCMQATSYPTGWEQPLSTQSEDCLYLNVYAPAVRPTKLLPVIFCTCLLPFHVSARHESASRHFCERLCCFNDVWTSCSQGFRVTDSKQAAPTTHA